MAGLSEEQILKFSEDGYLLVEDVYTGEQCNGLRQRCKHIVDTQLDLSNHPKSVFKTTNQKSDEYFMTSGDKIRFFFEENVFDEKGDLKYEKMQALNKIGHALHALDDEFKAATHADTIQACVRSLGYKKPVIPQSMYICKNAQVGGKVSPHQDGTFLHTEPLRLLGIWIALEDADTGNGCLSFAPGSHKTTGPLSRRMIRNPDSSDPPTVFVGSAAEVKEEAYIPVPVKKGAMVLIDGMVVHKSSPNLSDRSRHIYTFHIVESDGVEYSRDNWLQPTEQLPFPSFYTTDS